MKIGDRTEIGEHKAVSEGAHDNQHLHIVSLVCASCLAYGIGWADSEYNLALIQAIVQLSQHPCEPRETDGGS